MQLTLLYKTLDDVRRVDDGGEEYWHARDLWNLFGYANWRNFQAVIERAKDSCRTSGENPDFHFAQTRKMAKIGKNEAERPQDDFKLTRYACYLIAQNGDPKIPEIAFSQMYFAVQTRKQEVMEKNIEEIDRLIARRKLSETDKEFSKTLFERNIDGAGIGEIKAVGDKALFGGNSTNEMKERLGMGQNNPKPLADVLPTVTLKAKDLAQEMTTVNTKARELTGKDPIKAEHIKNSSGVREALVKSDIFPEKLPPAEDIKKVESRHKQQIKLSPPIGRKLLS